MKIAEILGWVLIITLFWSLGTYNIWMDYERREIAVPMLRLITNEATSGISALILVLFIRTWLDRFPPRQNAIIRTVFSHVLGAVIFSLAHVGVMMLLRSLTYMLLGRVYVHTIPDHPFGLFQTLAYEFAKDLPIYVGFVVILMLYRYWQSTENAELQNENCELQPQKLLVKDGKADKALNFDTIDWMQSSSNYVRIFSKNKEYLIRSTMAELEAMISSLMFMRVHRSYIVNLEKISAVIPISGGGHRIEMESGMHIPLGRNYKAILYRRIKGIQ